MDVQNDDERLKRSSVKVLQGPAWVRVSGSSPCFLAPFSPPPVRQHLGGEARSAVTSRKVGEGAHVHTRTCVQASGHSCQGTWPGADMAASAPATRRSAVTAQARTPPRDAAFRLIVRADPPRSAAVLPARERCDRGWTDGRLCNGSCSRQDRAATPAAAIATG